MNKFYSTIENTFSASYDFMSREIAVGGDASRAVRVLWLDSLVSGTALSDTVLRPLTDPLRFSPRDSAETLTQKLTGGSAYPSTVNVRDSASELVRDMLNGFCVILTDDAAVSMEVRSTDARSVDAPKEEKVIKGSKDAFTEILKTNITLIRRKIRDTRLTVKLCEIGKSPQAAAVVYLEGLASPDTVSQTVRRLGRISSDCVLSSAVIEERLSDRPRSPFPQIITTERADKFCINLLEGRVGVIADGLPIGYLAPGTFSQFFKVPEDAANHFIIATVLTLLRYAATVITLILPAFYVAVALYHQEMLPAKLMQSVIEAKKSVPFPTPVEIIMMLIAFELIQEAGLRLPDPVGEIVSIIGALIVGQAAVEARIVSPVVVIVIAVSAIAGTVMPSQDLAAALRLARFALVLFAIVGGMFGIAVGVVMLAYHLSTVDVFGVPYMEPFVGRDGRHTLRALGRGRLR